MAFTEPGAPVPSTRPEGPAFPGTPRTPFGPVQWQVGEVVTGRPRGHAWWVDVSPEDNRAMETAYTNGVNEFTMGADEAAGNQGWHVDFPHLIQTNNTTRTMRPIRRVVLITR